ncbi:MAG TPA: LuxR C-terminal-related transcriptional regulator [Streptosporangiaceae bacterium]
MKQASEVGDLVFLRMHQALPGALELARGDFAGAVAILAPLIPHLPELGRRFESLWTPEIIEALTGAGELDAADELLAKLVDRHKDPLSVAAAARCRGWLAAAAGRSEEAVAELTEALRLRERITDEPVERGRILLTLGSVQRRLKQRRAARELLGEAIACFEGASAEIWTERAKAELARVSGRVPGAVGELTVTERRVAELVAGGMSNRAAATQLVVTIRTIESTLTKVYAKLGVESRTQLASKLRDDG